MLSHAKFFFFPFRFVCDIFHFIKCNCIIKRLMNMGMHNVPQSESKLDLLKDACSSFCLYPTSCIDSVYRAVGPLMCTVGSLVMFASCIYFYCYGTGPQAPGQVRHGYPVGGETTLDTKSVAMLDRIILNTDLSLP